MATLLKPRAEKPATLRFSCSQQLAGRLKKLEEEAEKQGVEIDLDTALSAALERLVSAAEKELLPPAQDVAASSDSATQTPNY